ncbi:hypothetical protein KA183_06210 [bacterium]|nr:hypothetical protein [bacterium]QQR56290.1 MAG: hypothetical protein IPG59_14910 [Candidatus Melainabacteria bacterium]
MDYLADSIECPNCAELIKKNAKACRFCNHGLSNDHYRNCIACDERIKIQAKLCRFCGASDVAIPRVKVPEQLPSGVYGTSVRQQVFEVVMRQAMAGAPWKELCKGPMKVNGIDPKEIEEELKRRKAGLSDRDQNGDASKNSSGFPYETIDEEIEKVIELEQSQEKQRKKNKDKKRDEKGKPKRKNKPKDEENKE